MTYISELIGKPVVDIDGNKIGVLSDLLARFQKDLAHPIIVAIVAKKGDAEICYPYGDVAVMVPQATSLNKPLRELQTYILVEGDFYLVEDVLDKQIIDTDDARVVRANDLELLRVNGTLLVSNVDISTIAIFRRIGLEKPILGLVKMFRGKLPPNSISLDDVELMPHNQSLRLRIPGNKISSLHPADLAEIISDLNRSESDHLLGTLDIELLADTLEEVEPEFQASLINGMSDDKIADVLEEMSPDEAADLLGELPKERSEDLLKLMDKEEAQDVRMLLAYPEDSAGGIMTTDFAEVTLAMTAADVMAHLRATLEEAEPIFYVYALDEAGRLVGVFSLADLILTDPTRKVEDFMHRRVVSVHVDDDQERVAQMIAKYNLLAVPVVDEAEVMQGIVTADDALDQIIPTAWKKRLPRMYH